MHGSAKGAVIRRNLFTLYQKKLEPLLRLSLPILPAVPASYTRSADGHHLCAIPPFSAFAFACIDWSAAFPRVALRLNYRKKQRFSRTRLARIILFSINKTVNTTRSIMQAAPAYTTNLSRNQPSVRSNSQTAPFFRQKVEIDCTPKPCPSFLAIGSPLWSKRHFPTHGLEISNIMPGVPSILQRISLCSCGNSKLA